MFLRTRGVDANSLFLILITISYIGDIMKTNWFNTLNEALDSEGLLNTWYISNPPIGYNKVYTYTFKDNTKYGHYISIYRDERGMYERPVHYSRG